MYVGRRDGAAGKINITEEGGVKKMFKFWSHGHVAKQDAEILCLDGHAHWQDIMRGAVIPKNAVRAGTTVTDGVNYVGKAVSDSEPAKINCEEGLDVMCNCWAHHAGRIQYAAILVVM